MDAHGMHLRPDILCRVSAFDFHSDRSSGECEKMSMVGVVVLRY